MMVYGCENTAARGSISFDRPINALYYIQKSEWVYHMAYNDVYGHTNEEAVMGRAPGSNS